VCFHHVFCRQEILWILICIYHWRVATEEKNSGVALHVVTHPLGRLPLSPSSPQPVPCCSSFPTRWPYATMPPRSSNRRRQQQLSSQSPAGDVDGTIASILSDSFSNRCRVTRGLGVPMVLFVPILCLPTFSRSFLLTGLGLLRTPRASLRASLRASPGRHFGRRAPLTPQLKRASARRREEKDFRGVYKIQQVSSVHLGWGQAPSLETENDIRVHSMGAT